MHRHTGADGEFGFRGFRGVGARQGLTGNSCSRSAKGTLVAVRQAIVVSGLSFQRKTAGSKPIAYLTGRQLRQLFHDVAQPYSAAADTVRPTSQSAFDTGASCSN